MSLGRFSDSFLDVRDIRINTLLALSVSILCASFIHVPFAAAETERCFGRDATIEGTPGDDELIGTADADVIVGGAGADRIFGGGGDDRICGGRGFDELVGEEGDDRISGGRGGDSFGFAYLGTRAIYDPGDDVHLGGLGRDSFSDILGNNEVRGGSGDDDFFINDKSGNNVLDGGSGDDDFLVHGPGDDSILGGRGWDSVSYGNSRVPITADLSAGTVAGMGSDEIRGVEELSGSQAGDQILGSSKRNVLIGGDGADYIAGAGGDDRLYGGYPNGYELSPAPDRLFGQSGDDLLNTIDGVSGNDSVDGGAGGDVCEVDPEDATERCP